MKIVLNLLWMLATVSGNLHAETFIWHEDGVRHISTVSRDCILQSDDGHKYIDSNCRPAAVKKTVEETYAEALVGFAKEEGLMLNGRVMQVLGEGLLVTEVRLVSVKTNRVVMENTDQNVFIQTAQANAYVDGNTYSGIVFYIGNMQYRSTLGAVNTIMKYTPAAEY